MGDYTDKLTLNHKFGKNEVQFLMRYQQLLPIFGTKRRESPRLLLSRFCLKLRIRVNHKGKDMYYKPVPKRKRKQNKEPRGRVAAGGFPFFFSFSWGLPYNIRYGRTISSRFTSEMELTLRGLLACLQAASSNKVPLGINSYPRPLFAERCWDKLPTLTY